VTTETVKLLSTLPVIPVTDVAEAIAFYRDRLGFTVEFEQGPYAGVVRDDARLHLDGVVNAGAGTVTCRVETSGVDDLFAEMDGKGVVDPKEPIHTMPWGARQFSVLDCCGNRITFVHSA
jgi:uncharacterized glyoxalase superfamily protein PhnB